MDDLTNPDCHCICECEDNTACKCCTCPLTPIQLYDEFGKPRKNPGPAMTLRERRWLKHYMDHGNATQAARESGYQGKPQTLSQRGFENRTKLQPFIAEILEAEGISTEALARKLMEGLNATLTVTAQQGGKITDEREYVDYQARKAYLEMAFKLLNAFPQKGPQVNVETSGETTIKVVYSDAERPSSADEDD